jgi:hypothetical protein
MKKQVVGQCLEKVPGSKIESFEKALVNVKKLYRFMNYLQGDSRANVVKKSISQL